VSAHTRLNEQIFTELQPQVRRLMDELASAKDAAPALLVSQALGEPSTPGPTVAEAEAALAEAERTLANARAARSQLGQEVERRAVLVSHAERGLDDAHRAVVETSPELAELKARHLALTLMVWRTIGAMAAAGFPVSMPVGVGLLTALRDAGAPVSAPPHDRAWVAALAALRTDPDTTLPSLPDDEHADAGTAAAA
jgi:predicted transcriptional regulator